MDGGNLLSTLVGHSGGVWGLDADTIRVTSVSQDKSVRVWDLHSGKSVNKIVSHNSPVRCVWLTDTKLISGDDEGVITVRDFLSI